MNTYTNLWSLRNRLLASQRVPIATTATGQQRLVFFSPIFGFLNGPIFNTTTTTAPAVARPTTTATLRPTVFGINQYPGFPFVTNQVNGGYYPIGGVAGPNNVTSSGQLLFPGVQGQFIQMGQPPIYFPGPVRPLPFIPVQL